MTERLIPCISRREKNQRDTPLGEFVEEKLLLKDPSFKNCELLDHLSSLSLLFWLSIRSEHKSLDLWTMWQLCLMMTTMCH
jgi:hypothetical protein